MIRVVAYMAFFPYLMHLGKIYFSNKFILQLSRSLSYSKYLRWRFQFFFFACIRRDLGRWQGEQCLGGIAGMPAEDSRISFERYVHTKVIG